MGGVNVNCDIVIFFMMAALYCFFVGWNANIQNVWACHQRDWSWGSGRSGSGAPAQVLIHSSYTLAVTNLMNHCHLTIIIWVVAKVSFLLYATRLQIFHQCEDEWEWLSICALPLSGNQYRVSPTPHSMSAWIGCSLSITLRRKTTAEEEWRLRTTTLAVLVQMATSHTWVHINYPSYDTVNIFIKASSIILMSLTVNKSVKRAVNHSAVPLLLKTLSEITTAPL